MSFQSLQGTNIEQGQRDTYKPFYCWEHLCVFWQIGNFINLTYFRELEVPN